MRVKGGEGVWFSREARFTRNDAGRNTRTDSSPREPNGRGPGGIRGPAGLQAAGVELRWYNRIRWRRGLRNLYRDHRKLLVVDQTWAVVGGTGVTDQFWTPGEDVSEWHEVMVQMQGPLVADWQMLFDRQWRSNLRRTAWRHREQLAAEAYAAARPSCPLPWGSGPPVPTEPHKIADAVPGRLNETWFTVEKEGTFYGQCNQICGTDHAYMPIAVQAGIRISGPKERLPGP